MNGRFVYNQVSLSKLSDDAIRIYSKMMKSIYQYLFFDEWLIMTVGKEGSDLSNQADLHT